MSKKNKKRSKKISKALFREQRQWDRCRIKSIPAIEREVTDRRGRVSRERGVEEMLKLWKRRMAKSGIMEKYHESRYFQKPSDARRRQKQERDYKIEKANERRAEREERLRKGE